MKIKKIFLYFFLTFLSFLFFGCNSIIDSKNDNDYIDQNQSDYSSYAKPRKINYLEASKINTQLGIHYLREGLYKRSKEKLLLALKQYHDYGPNLTAMAYYYEKTGDPELANEYYVKAVNIDKNDGYVLNNYGTFLCRQKKYEQAIKYFERAVNDKGYLNTGEAYENAAICAEKIPNIKIAKQYYEKALKTNPNLKLSLVSLIKISYKEKQLSKSREYLDKLKKHVGSDNPDVAYLDKLINNKKS